MSLRHKVALIALVLTGAATLAEAGSVVVVKAVRGKHIIGANDVAIVETETPGAFVNLNEVVGREARVTLYPGRPVMKGQVGPPAVVERNQLVRMTFSSGALNIVTDGRTLDRGGVGESVRVMNLSSRQIVSGIVDDDGTIKVSR